MFRFGCILKAKKQESIGLDARMWDREWPLGVRPEKQVYGCGAD